jgi:predicted MFS family arabinose efflux permease
MRPPRRFGPLEERQFRLLYAGQAVSLLGDALAPLAMAFAVLELTGSASDLGYVFAAQLVPLVVFILAGGVWADRLPRQLVMLGSDVVRGSVQAVVAFLLLTDRAKLWQLIVLAAVYGTGEAFFRPAATALIPSTVQASALQQANALLAMTMNGANVIGPALAGVMVAAANPGIALAIDAGTFAVSACFLVQLRPAAVERLDEPKSFAREIAAGWHEFRSRTWLWAIVLGASLLLFAGFAPFQVLGPYISKTHYGGATAWALILAAFALGQVAGGGVALRWRPARPLYVCAITNVFAAPPLALLALTAPAAAVAGAILVTGVGVGIFGALWETTMQTEIPPDRLARVSSYDWMGSVAFLPAGLALAGPVSAAIGVSTTLWCGVAVVALSTAIMLAPREVRELRAKPHGGVGSERMAA